jgi:ubiquinol-cytochrome c reductase cytochrome c1 subunit
VFEHSAPRHIDSPKDLPQPMLKAFVFVSWLLAAAMAHANESLKLDEAPIDSRDVASIQRGVRVFVNYCLTCHSATSMRYSRLEDLGLTAAQIKDNLMFTTDKPGAPMAVAMRIKDAQEWFGVAPPDLSVISRARGPDWLYTYLRSFYRDDSTSTGWNNLVFPNVGMPHVLWELQGQQTLKVVERQGQHGKQRVKTLVLSAPGTLDARAYDTLVADLVNYLMFMGEPARQTRMQIGYVVLIFLGVLFVPIYLLKQDYWKEVH